MRVKVDNYGKIQFGEFVGMLGRGGCDRCEGETDSAVVRLDAYGMFLVALHPSRVSFTTPEEEAAYKP